MDFALIGYTAGFLTTFSFLPQVIKAYRTRSCADLSWPWLVVFVVGLSLWLTYGVILKNWPMILANSITLSFCFVLVWLKFRYERPPLNP
jgi:MtN3 and saliva related transmembrane protein